jgi:hypothetical protein
MYNESSRLFKPRLIDTIETPRTHGDCTELPLQHRSEISAPSMFLSAFCKALSFIRTAKPLIMVVVEESQLHRCSSSRSPACSSPFTTYREVRRPIERYHVLIWNGTVHWFENRWTDPTRADADEAKSTSKRTFKTSLFHHCVY